MNGRSTVGSGFPSLCPLLFFFCLYFLSNLYLIFYTSNSIYSSLYGNKVYGPTMLYMSVYFSVFTYLVDFFPFFGFVVYFPFSDPLIFSVSLFPPVCLVCFRRLGLTWWWCYRPAVRRNKNDNLEVANSIIVWLFVPLPALTN